MLAHLLGLIDLKELWKKPVGLAIVLLLVTGSFLGVFNVFDLENVSIVEWAFLLPIVVVIALVWWLSNRVPRVPKAAVGFGVAIEFESKKHAESVGVDFIRRLKEFLTRDEASDKFYVLEFAPRFSKRLDRKAASALLHKSHCTFLVYGVGRLRSEGGKPVHVFDLTGIVTHAPIPQLVAHQFCQEFTSVFPGKLQVGTDRDFVGFEFTAAWVDIAVRYIVAIASHFTGNFTYAEQLLLSLEQQLRDQEPSNQQIIRIKQGIPLRLRDIYRSQAYIAGNDYRVSRDKADLKKVEEALDKLDARKMSNYRCYLLRAITAFALHRDMETAKEVICRCRKFGDATWLYSEAFLKAYDGDLEGAYRSYRKAFAAPQDDKTIPIQVEEFIQIVIDEESNRSDLYFCLGYLNYKCKGDLFAARRDLEKFLSDTSKSAFPAQHDACEKWIGEIDQQIGPTASEQVVRDEARCAHSRDDAISGRTNEALP